MIRASRRRIVCGGGPSPPTSIVPGTSRAPDSSIISRVATPGASIACSGWSCFSNRPEASLRSPSFSEVRWMFGAVPVRRLHQHARGVRAAPRERAPPITPAIDVGPSSSSIRTMSRSSVRVCPSSVSTCSPSRGAADGELRAGHAVEVERVQRLPGQQHHVVGDVDHVRDRPLAGGHQPRLQPRRARPDLHVLEHARGEARAQLGALDGDRRRRAGRPGLPGSSRHGGGASGAPVAAWTSRATP